MVDLESRSDSLFYDFGVAIYKCMLPTFNQLQTFTLAVSKFLISSPVLSKSELNASKRSLFVLIVVS